MDEGLKNGANRSPTQHDYKQTNSFPVIEADGIESF